MLGKMKTFVRKHKDEFIQLSVMAVVVAPTIIGMSGAEAAQSGSNATSVGSLPWHTGVNALKDELTGPLPRIAGIVAVAVSGALMAFGEMSGMTKKAIQVTFGLGIAISATSLVSALTGTDVSGLMF